MKFGFGATNTAADSTDNATQMANEELRGKLEALDKSQAVIEFNLDGTIITANENFIKTVDYSLEEIQGQHHRMFVEPTYGQSEEYRRFWTDLNQGRYQAGEFNRFGKGGKEIWLQASYNPIFIGGKLAKVVKYAADITEQVAIRSQTQKVGQSVAAALTEMTHTIREISESVSNCATLAQSTSGAAQAAGCEVQTLTANSQKIGGVVGVIRSLSEQTKLLALNATIEAARAGENGRGFAVVANEVKELAKQTGDATEGISESVAAIQASIESFVSSTQEIETGVSDVSENTTTVAAAIEEQSATMASLGQTSDELLALTVR